MHELIRPRREDVIRRYIGLSLLALILLSDEMAAAVANLFALEGDRFERFISFSIDVIVALLLMRFLLRSALDVDGVDEERRFTRTFSFLILLLIVWSFCVHDVLDPPALMKVLLIFSPLILTDATLVVVINRRKPNHPQVN